MPLEPDSLKAPTAQAQATWAVIGATGFVGRNLVAELKRHGYAVREVHAQRLCIDADSDLAALVRALDHPRQRRTIDELDLEFRDCQIVVNAAGLATPAARPSPEMLGANALLPAVVVLAAAGVSRFIHVSSAAVQGRMEPLDESPNVAPSTPYAESKALGEALLARTGRVDRQLLPEVSVLRATSVHGPDRARTASLARLAKSRFSCVAGRGDRATPVASVTGLAGAVRFVGASSSARCLGSSCNRGRGLRPAEFCAISAYASRCIFPCGYADPSSRSGILSWPVGGGGAPSSVVLSCFGSASHRCRDGWRLADSSAWEPNVARRPPSGP